MTKKTSDDQKKKERKIRQKNMVSISKYVILILSKLQARKDNKHGKFYI